MTETEKIKIMNYLCIRRIVGIVAAVVIGALCFAAGRCSAPMPEPEVVRDTIIKAVAVPSPRAESVRPVRPQLFAVPVTETRTERDTVFVILERTQAKYDSAGVYTAYVSGVDPRLDSLTIYDHTITEVVTVWEPAKVWRHNVGIGAAAMIAKQPAIAPEVYYRYSAGRWGLKAAVQYDIINRSPAMTGTITYDLIRLR